LKILLLSAYAAASHVHWQRTLQVMFPAWEWRLLSLPPRHFSWRVRGNPLYWSMAQRPQLEQDYDLLIATSMVDLATLRGLVPALSRLPSLLYFHENQFDYPQQSRQSSLLEAQMVSLYSALSADRLAFNSGYNRDSFLAGVDALLRKLQDRVPAGVVAALAAKADVLPVPIACESSVGLSGRWPGATGDEPGRPVRLLWAGRFEHDKGGDTLWHALDQLERAGLAYELAVTGQQFRRSPPEFARIGSDYQHRLVQFGYLASTTDYQALLRAADIVLSTARHEFQGLAVLEAVASGCLPAVPDRQAYPELYDARFRYPVHGGQPELEGAAAAALVCKLATGLRHRELAPPDVTGFGTSQLRPRYEALLQGMARPAG